METPANTYLFYDGECGFCSRTVRFVLAHERSAQLRFAALQSGFARHQLKSHGIDEPSMETMYVIDGDTLYERSDAALRVAGMLRPPWSWAKWFSWVPKGLRDWAYDRVARHRHQLGEATSACELPSADDRARFLD